MTLYRFPVTVLVSILFYVVSFAPSATAAEKLVWKFGTYTLEVTTPIPPPLTVKLSAWTDPDFSLRRLGSVNFAGRVNLSPSKESPVSISYIPTNADGQRLEIALGNHKHNPAIPDWQLVPIALFADSDYTAAVSLFGDGPDTLNYFYIQYHPAFQDTLLGIRLLQVAMVPMDPVGLAGLPSVNNKTILGAEEKAPNLDEANIAGRGVLDVLGDFHADAWIYTDAGPFADPGRELNTEFHHHLTFKYYSGPWSYYLFWSHLFAQPKAVLRETVAYIRDEVTSGKITKAEANDKIAILESLIKGGIDQRTAEAKIGLALSEIVSGRANYLHELTDRVLHQLHYYQFGKYDNKLSAYNGPLYTAAENVGWYAAIFRSVRFRNPRGWHEFIESIRAVKVEPRVQTPTRWNKERVPNRLRKVLRGEVLREYMRSP